MRRARNNQLIEFKGNSLSVIVVTLRSLQPDELSDLADELFGDDAFFDGDAALFELGQVGAAESADWMPLCALFARHGLHVVGVRGGSDALRDDALAAGLPDFPATERRVPSEPPIAEDSVEHELCEPAARDAAASPSPEVAPPPLQSGGTPTLVVERPLRSGQQIYARGGDLVVLAAVSSGAEVIADGSIHIYAPLRGRALAGASGARGARIFTTRFEAELVSIAGIYRTFESGVPDNLAGQPVQIQLSETAGEESNRLSIVALKTS
jgi:septum site-determining protein MinC